MQDGAMRILDSFFFFVILSSRSLVAPRFLLHFLIMVTY